VRGQLDRDAVDELSQELVATLLDASRHPDDVHHLIEGAIANGWAGADIYLQVLPIAWHEIGARWQNGQISGDEHLATSVIQSAMRSLAPSLPRSPRHGRSVSIAAIDGERHDNGLRMLTDVLDAAGWDVFLLGTALSAFDLVRHLRERSPDAIAIGITRPDCLHSLERAVVAIRAELPYRPFILLGGQGVPRGKAYAYSIDADAWAADPQEAVTALAEARANA
jgi:MerR family transcriptional regulator, light-induced transcriptional regulator